MTMIQDAPVENLSEFAARLIGSQKSKYMEVIYAKRPTTYPGTDTPFPDAGYVTLVDNDQQTGAIWRKIASGWHVLEKYGKVRFYPDEGGSRWDQILRAPGGPAEFPIAQIMEFGWYDPSRVPVAGVKFPQLRGETIRVLPCPECPSRRFLKPIHLAQHCRGAHNYDRQDIKALGDQLGIDFVKEMFNGRKREYTFDYADEPEAVAEPVIPPDYEVETVAIAPRSTAPAPKPRTEKQLANDAKLRAAAEERRAAKAS